MFLSLLANLSGLFSVLYFGMLLPQRLADATFYTAARWIGCLAVWSFVSRLTYGLAPFIFTQMPRGAVPKHVGGIAHKAADDYRCAHKQIEPALPANARVFQLPVMDVPQSLLPCSPSYDRVRP